jgi:hypothetical protein
MDNRKFEQLIDMIINENEEQARELFHEIVVEKSREIYESMMDEEDLMESGDMVGDLQDEIESDDQMSMTEDEDMEDEEELDDISMDMDDMEMDDEEDEMRDEADLEDRVVDLEDKLDELMAEFEEIMGRDEEEEMGDEEEMDMMENPAMMGAMRLRENPAMKDEEEEEAMMEAIQLKKVSVTHGDNGVQTKSVVSKGPKVPGNGAAPVNFSGGGDSKGRPNPSVKDVDGSSSWQNKAGKDMAKPGKAPAPVKSQASGTNTKDVVPGN